MSSNRTGPKTWLLLILIVIFSILLLAIFDRNKKGGIVDRLKHLHSTSTPSTGR